MLKTSFLSYHIFSQNETHELQLWEKELCEREAILKDHEDSSTQQDLSLNERFEKELQAQCSIINEVFT